MTLEEAYEILGLTPLDQMLSGALPGGRRAGATTWMLVEAALCLVGGGNAMVVGRNLREGVDLAQECLGYFTTLVRPQHPVHTRQGRYWELNNGALLWGSTPHTKAKDLRGRPPFTVFEDREYALKALERADGPYINIRRIDKTDDDRFLAYDKDGIFLLELDEEGASFITNSDGFRIRCVGW